ncbi:MAG TPA: DUF1343 domain-containing protein [Ignavibacteriales bacterium]|nr:DUF1343 domain-containing protein [Ignavibacteriales bacterium]
MRPKYNFILLSIVFLLSIPINAQIVNGADLLFSENLNLITKKNVGAVCNHTSLLTDGTHLVDALIEQKGVTVKVIFTPEHGFKGSAEAGEHIDYKNNLYKEVPIVSLYGKDRKPTKENLTDVDVLIFDIQDIGARFYTYISTLYYVLESAGENNIPVIILDRPNPIGGSYVDGPVLDEKYKSFVGIAQIPITHGMTVGELAKYFVGEKLISSWKNISLTVINCKNWKREIPSEFNSNWNSPSPNINSLETALVYPGICLLEGTNVSEGRGTYYPFLQVGAPFINAEQVIEKLNLLKIESAEFQPVSFTPKNIAAMATNPKYENTVCSGIKIKITEPTKFESVKFGVKLLHVLVKLYGNKIKFNDSFDRLAGTDVLRKQLKNKNLSDQIFASWQSDLTKFIKKRNQYLLY